jgi:hypothetical protein
VARSTIPDPLARRHLLERALAPAQALAIGAAYLAEGRQVEAVEFLAKAGAAERLAELRREAVAAGDVFLLRMIAAADGTPASRAEWQAVAAAAEVAGKARYVTEAQRQADRGKG